MLRVLLLRASLLGRLRSLHEEAHEGEIIQFECSVLKDSWLSRYLFQ